MRILVYLQEISPIAYEMQKLGIDLRTKATYLRSTAALIHPLRYRRTDSIPASPVSIGARMESDALGADGDTRKVNTPEVEVVEWTG